MDARLLLTVGCFVLIGPCGVAVVTGQVVSTGACPNPPAMENFNVSRYAGRWYEMERYWFLIETTTSCAMVDYFPNFDVNIQQVEGVTKTVLRNEGHTRFLSFDGSADVSLEVLVNQSPAPFSAFFPYKVLATDYKTFTIKYSCIQQGLLSFETMWILSKSKKGFYTPKTRAKVHRILHKYGLNTDKLIQSAFLLGAQCPW